MTGRRRLRSLGNGATDLRLVSLEDCPAAGRAPSIPRQFGLTLEDTLLGILAAPCDAERISRETLDQAAKESQ